MKQSNKDDAMHRKPYLIRLYKGDARRLEEFTKKSGLTLSGAVRQIVHYSIENKLVGKMFHWDI